MKRITAVLVLVLVGALMSSAPLFLGEAQAEAQSTLCIEVSGGKLFSPEETQGKPEDDNEGDPDAGGDGLGYDDPDSDVLDAFGIFGETKELELIELWKFLMSSTWLLP